MKLIHSLATRHATFSVAVGTPLSDLDALTDPNPGERVRIAPVAAAQGSVVAAVDVTLPDAIEPIAACVRGLRGVPDGCRVRVKIDMGALWIAAGGNTQIARTVRLPDGDVGVTFVIIPPFPGSRTRFRLEIVNDVAGGAWPGGVPAEIEIGTFAVGAGAEYVASSGWSIDGKRPGALMRTLGSQLNAAHQPGYRVLRVKPDVSGDAAAYQDAASWQHIAGALRRDPVVLAIVREETEEDIQFTSVYGAATSIPTISHAGGQTYALGELVVEEIPG